MATQPTESSVRFAAKTKLLDLAYEIAQSRSIRKVQKQIDQATNIFLWLQALDYEAYLTASQVEKIWLCLIQLAEIYDYPIAPELGNLITPVIVGSGTTVINNNTYTNGTLVQNTDVDTGTNIVDEFSIALGRTAFWIYEVYNGDIHQRGGTYEATWTSTGSLFRSQHDSTDDIGNTTGVTLSSQFNSGNIRLVVTANSDNWVFKATRFII